MSYLINSFVDYKRNDIKDETIVAYLSNSLLLPFNYHKQFKYEFDMGSSHAALLPL